MADLLLDGCMDFLGGQDASKIPDRIPENCYASGVNVSVKRASISPRWGFNRLTLTYPEGVITDNFGRQKEYKTVFETGKFQALAPYFIGDLQYLVIVIAGTIFFLNPQTYELTVIPIEGGSRLNARAPRIRWSAAGKYLILYDFPDFPVIIDGLEARRANPLNYEIPVSTIGAFNQNRLFVANAGNEFTGGDPVGNTATPNAPITFEEVLLTGSPYFGQIFQLPTTDHNDPITYMGFLQVTDSSTGIGPLIIGTERAVYSFATQAPRSSWDQTQFGSIICYNAGIVGPRAFVNVNSDAFFLSSDGYARALSMSRDEQRKWARIPISREVENWFTYWDKELASFAFVASFQNKVFFSVNPYRTTAIDLTTSRPISDYAHGGLVVMELDNLTSFGEASKPAWAGLWTGVRPMDMVNLADRAFIISKDYNINQLYEVDSSTNFDTAGNCTRFVRSRIYTREHDFKDPFFNKEIHSIDFNFDNLAGDFKLDVKYKPSHAAGFYPWKTFSHPFPWRTAAMPDSCLLNGFAPQFIRDFTLGAPEGEEHSPTTNDFYRVFRKIQLQLTLTGRYWEVHEYRIKAAPRPVNPTQSIEQSYPVVAVCQQCYDDWYVGDFEGCLTTQT